MLKLVLTSIALFIVGLLVSLLINVIAPMTFFFSLVCVAPAFVYAAVRGVRMIRELV